MLDQTELEPAIAATKGDRHPSFTVEVGALLKAVNSVRGATEKSNNVPILGYILLTLEPGKITLTATDMEISITKWMVANVRVPGRLAVPATMLSDALARMTASDVLDVVSTDDNITIKAGRSRVNITTLPPDEFPRLTVGEMGNRIELDAGVLGAALTRVNAFISTSEARWDLCGVYFGIGGDGSIRICSTNIGTFAEVTIANPSNVQFDSLTIPRKAIGHMRTHLSAQSGNIAIEASQTAARIAFGDVVLITKLIDWAFPKYENHLPKDSDHPLWVDCASMRQSVSLVAGLSENDKLRPLVFEMTSTELVVSTLQEQRDAVRCELLEGEINYDGDDLRIVLNGRAMDSALSTFSGDVEFHFSDAEHPISLRDTGDRGVLYVLSSLRY